jgi:hypothetical protein
MASAFAGARQTEPIKNVANSGDSGNVTYGEGTKDAGLTRERFNVKGQAAPAADNKQKTNQQPGPRKGGIDILV